MSGKRREAKGSEPAAVNPSEPVAGDPRRPPPGPSTVAVHGGEPRPKPGHALATPIIQTATYTFAHTQELKDHFEGRIDRVEYGRYGNPTQRIAENKLAALEHFTESDDPVFAAGSDLAAVQQVRRRRVVFAWCEFSLGLIVSWSVIETRGA